MGVIQLAASKTVSVGVQFRPSLSSVGDKPVWYMMEECGEECGHGDRVRDTLWSRIELRNEWPEGCHPKMYSGRIRSRRAIVAMRARTCSIPPAVTTGRPTPASVAQIDQPRLAGVGNIVAEDQFRRRF